MRGSIRTAILLAIAIGAASPALGQGAHPKMTSQVPRYIPSTPTVSPYVGLLNRNGGAASNYYGLIRPLQRQAALNATQSQAVSSQEQELKTVQEEQKSFEQPTVKPTGTAGWFQNTGAMSPYQVSSHYYGQWPSSKSKKKPTGR